jgi:hypothetical protein
MSAPATRTAVTSVDPHASLRGGVREPASRPSRIHVDSALRHAFQYRWNCSSVAACELMLCQRIVSRPFRVRDP